MPPKLSVEIEFEPQAKAEMPEMEDDSPEEMRRGGAVRKKKGGSARATVRGAGCAVRGSRACKKY